MSILSNLLVVSLAARTLARVMRPGGSHDAAARPFDEPHSGNRDRMARRDPGAANIKNVVAAAIDASACSKALGDRRAAARASEDAGVWARLWALGAGDPSHRLFKAKATPEPPSSVGNTYDMTIITAIGSAYELVAEHLVGTNPWR